MSAPTTRSRTGLLAVGALGVVFGDIGTSPLYAFSEIFAGDHPIAVVEPRVLGALSLVFWTLTLVVSVKYVLIVMRADNHGEGGIMALASLATSVVKNHRAAATIMAFGVLGAALFYGDGMITPAISVLSAVEGLEVASPDLSDYIVPIALVLLIGLFVMQRFGTGRVGAIFGPVMLLWFLVIGIFGLMSLVQTPSVLVSISPSYAINYFLAEPTLAFMSLGSVVLCVTGAEALYADMGQFGKRPIRISWFVVAAPALYLNYLGQGALVLRDPSTADNSFYLMVPGFLQWPMIILATVATIIASQAVISGAFSMTQQAVLLGYLPRMTIRHTSTTERGQIYVPFVNWMLMIAIVGLVIGFGSSSALASAYGIAVTGTFVITTCLITVVARHLWKVPLAIIIPLTAVFLVIDGSFFLANLLKFDHGGWFPLIVAAIIFTLLSIWRWGTGRLKKHLGYVEVPMSELPSLMKAHDVTTIPGTTVYVVFQEGIPLAMLQRLRLFHVVDESVVIVRVRTAEVPRVEESDRLRIDTYEDSIVDVVATYGFMERPDPARVVATVARSNSRINAEVCLYMFYVVHLEPTKGSLPLVIGSEIFGFMLRNATDPQQYYGLPPDRVVEGGIVAPL